MSSSEIPNSCHICGQSTEFTCRDCVQPACEDCLVPFTPQNNIDYCLCNYCHEEAEARRFLGYLEESERQEARKSKKAEANAKRRANYWKPENIEKRRLAKIKRQKEKEEDDRKRAAELVKVMRDFMRFF